MLVQSQHTILAVNTSTASQWQYLRCLCHPIIGDSYFLFRVVYEALVNRHVIRGQTDKKLTSMLVIWTF